MAEVPDFGEFVRANSRSLLRAAWLLTGDWTLAEDLVQTALANCWPRWSRIATHDAYVRRTMTTTFLGWRRRRWTNEIATENLPDTGRVDDTADVASHRVLRDAMAALSPQQRAAVVLRYFADLSEADTAQAMGCSVGAVKSHTSRAVARLREAPGVAELMS